MRTFTILVGLLLAVFFLPPAHAHQEEHHGTQTETFGGWKDNSPGVIHQITPADLPRPTHTENDPEAPDFANAATVVDAPKGTTPDVPDGFKVEVFAKGLDQPRVIRIAPNGDIFVAESGSTRESGGQISVFPAGSTGDSPAKPEVFADSLDRPYGIAFYPPDDPQYVYVGAANEVVRYPYHVGDREASGPPEVIIADIPTKRHWTRDLAVSADGKHLFVAIGSSTNVAPDMPKKTPEEIQAFEKTHGVGAAWGDEENRAVIREFSPDGSDIRNYATGLRNPSGLAIQPATGELWASVNERDHIGSNLVPDFVTRVREGGFYGWPWYYIGDHEDPAHAGERSDLEGKVVVPDVLIQPHSSTLNLTFYDGDAFPAEYQGDAFAVEHGSWNRKIRTGYKVIRIFMKDGKPTGEYQDFMTGFVLDKDTVWGRPAGLAVAQDGSLLVSDDANGTIFRITYQGSD